MTSKVYSFLLYHICGMRSFGSISGYRLLGSYSSAALSLESPRAATHALHALDGSVMLMHPVAATLLSEFPDDEHLSGTAQVGKCVPGGGWGGGQKARLTSRRGLRNKDRRPLLVHMHAGACDAHHGARHGVLGSHAHAVPGAAGAAATRALTHDEAHAPAVLHGSQLRLKFWALAHVHVFCVCRAAPGSICCFGR